MPGETHNESNSMGSAANRRTSRGNRRAIVLACVGLVLLGVMWFYNRGLETRPVYILIPVGQGAMSDATFVPTHTDVYQLEVELRKPADSDAFEKCIRTTDAGALDGAWTVTSSGEQVATGHLGSYLYLSMTGPSRRRVLQAVGLDSYHDVGTFRISRGVGRFRATAGEPVKIELKIESAITPEFAVGEPRLVVRLDRRVTAKYLNVSMAIAIFGIGLIGLSLLSCLWNARQRKSSIELQV